MTKRLLLLNGIAALMVPIHHATAFGLQAMIDWADRYRNVASPNFDMIGTLPFVITMILRQLDAYAIPAFFLVSGFFIAFMARGKKLTWESMTPRIHVIAIPLVVWTIIRFVLLRRLPTSFEDIFDTYYFLVLLVQYYLLSPFIVPLAKSNWKLILVVTLFIQLLAESHWYLNVIGVQAVGMDQIKMFTPRWFAPSRIFYFTIGIIAGLNILTFREWLTRAKWVLLVIVIVSGVLSYFEYEYLTQLSGRVWIGPNNPGITRFIYASTFSLCFLAFNKSEIPLSKFISDIGSKSLGVYLVNVPVIYVSSVLMYKFLPQLLGNPLLYQGTLLILGLAVPLLLMESVRRSPLRGVYRYLFG